MQNHPEFKGLKGLCQYLQFIPLPDEVMDFFKPVASQIIQLLKGKAFLPTLSPGTTHTKRHPMECHLNTNLVHQEQLLLFSSERGGADYADRYIYSILLDSRMFILNMA